MRLSASFVATLALVVAFVPDARAWGPQGHRTVGAIADRLLTPAAHAAVAQLLATDLDSFGNPSGRTTLESVSVWADEIRGTAADEPHWHHDDMPACGAAPPREEYCPNGECNSAQIERLSRVLADAHADPRARNEALKWIVHLIGDLHQPLHGADNNDHGGNRVSVALAGVRTHGRLTLHGVWDVELAALALNTRNREPPPDIDALAREAQRLSTTVGQGTPESWARESNTLARRVAYHYPGFECGLTPQGIVVLDEHYQREASGVVRERLLLAGGRLAGLLNQLLPAR